MTYNELQTAVKQLQALTGVKPSDRKKATLQAYVDQYGTCPVEYDTIDTEVVFPTECELCDTEYVRTDVVVQAVVHESLELLTIAARHTLTVIRVTYAIALVWLEGVRLLWRDYGHEVIEYALLATLACIAFLSWAVPAFKRACVFTIAGGKQWRAIAEKLGASVILTDCELATA